MEALSVEAFLVRQVIEGVGDKIDRNDVDATALDADRGNPRREHRAHLLNQLEKVVRAIDLVDISCFGMADDEARAVDAPGPLVFLAHDAFRDVLGAKVRMIEVLGFLEHVFAKHAVVEACRSDRAHMMKAAGLDAFRELNGMARPVDVGALLVLCARREVVNGSQMKQVRNLALELFQICVRHTEVGFGQVADDRHNAFLQGAPRLPQRIELL